MTMYQEVYNLKNSAGWIRFIQEASLSKDRRVGLKMENGLLFGTDRWFDAINNGNIPKHVISGHISRVYMSGHNDYPEFEVTDKDGIKTVWDRPTNDDRFVEGRGVEVMYVVQKFKTGETTNCLIKVSIDSMTEEYIAKLKGIEQQFNDCYEPPYSLDRQANESIKNGIKELIVAAYEDSALAQTDKDTVIKAAMTLMAENTGCAEDCEIADAIFDELFGRRKIITQTDIDDFYAASDIGRWR